MEVVQNRWYGIIGWKNLSDVLKLTKSNLLPEMLSQKGKRIHWQAGGLAKHTAEATPSFVITLFKASHKLVTVSAIWLMLILMVVVGVRIDLGH